MAIADSERTSRKTESYAVARNKQAAASNGIDYTYRDVGDGEVPLLLLQHFRGNLDNWDPALIDGLATHRRVVAFDNVGVGNTTGTTPHSVDAMAVDALTFLDAMNLERVDVLGFSLGSFVAQEMALLRPSLLRRVVLASAAPRGAPGMHGWAPDVIAAVGGRELNPQGYLDVFFPATSRRAGEEALTRMFSRTGDPDQPTSWQTRQAQYDAVCAWGVPNHAMLQRLAEIDQPVLLANGDSDPMILPRYSYLLAGLLPNAQLTIYPNAAHGFLFQYHDEFAANVNAFLDGGP
jgi:pimeloyl-ACP methyl ester carboxylesterase